MKRISDDYDDGDVDPGSAHDLPSCNSVNMMKDQLESCYLSGPAWTRAAVVACDRPAAVVACCSLVKGRKSEVPFATSECRKMESVVGERIA